MGRRFNFDVHNDRRLDEHRGATPEETLVRFRRIVTSTTAASGHTAAWLGEVVVHAQDLLRPLGLRRTPHVTGTTLALTMAMAGRRAYCDDLTGPGVPVLRTLLAHLRSEARRTHHLRPAHADDL